MSIAFGLAFLALGLAIFASARAIGRFMIWQGEVALRLMRRPWFVWYYRAFGIIFAVSGVSLLFSRSE